MSEIIALQELTGEQSAAAVAPESQLSNGICDSQLSASWCL